MEAQRAIGEAAAARILVAARQSGNPAVINHVEPWRVALQRGRGRSLAVRTNRKAGKRSAPKPCSQPLSDTDTPEPPHWTAGVKASRAVSQHLLRLRPSRASEATDRPSPLSYPTPTPGARGEPGVRSIMLRIDPPGRATRQRTGSTTTTDRTRARAVASVDDRRQGCGAGLRDGSPTGQRRRRPAARHRRGHGPQPHG